MFKVKLLQKKHIIWGHKQQIFFNKVSLVRDVGGHDSGLH